MNKCTCDNCKPSKKWWKSRTLWFNLVILIMGSVDLLSTVIEIPTEVLTLVAGFGNLLLRFITNKKLSK